MALEPLKAKLDALMVEDEIQSVIGTRKLNKNGKVEIVGGGNNDASQVDDEEQFLIQEALKEARQKRKRENQKIQEAQEIESQKNDKKNRNQDKVLLSLQKELRVLEKQGSSKELKRTLTLPELTGGTGAGSPENMSRQQSSAGLFGSFRKTGSSLNTQSSAELGSNNAKGSSAASQPQEGGRGGGLARTTESPSQAGVGGAEGSAASSKSAAEFELRRTKGRTEGHSLLDDVRAKIALEKEQQAKHAAELEAARLAAAEAELYEAKYSAMRRKLKEQVLREVFGSQFRPMDIDKSAEHENEEIEGEEEEEAPIIHFQKSEYAFLSQDPNAPLDSLILGAQAGNSALWGNLMTDASSTVNLEATAMYTLNGLGGNEKKEQKEKSREESAVSDGTAPLMQPAVSFAPNGGDSRVSPTSLRRLGSNLTMLTVQSDGTGSTSNWDGTSEKGNVAVLLPASIEAKNLCLVSAKEISGIRGGLQDEIAALEHEQDVLMRRRARLSAQEEENESEKDSKSVESLGQQERFQRSQTEPGSKVAPLKKKRGVDRRQLRPSQTTTCVAPKTNDRNINGEQETSSAETKQKEVEEDDTPKNLKERKQNEQQQLAEAHEIAMDVIESAAMSRNEETLLKQQRLAHRRALAERLQQRLQQ